MIDYNPETGALIWRERTAEVEPNAISRKAFNKQYSGKPVGSTALIAKDIRVFLRGRTYSARSLAYLIMTGSLPTSRTRNLDGDKYNLRWNNLATVEEVKAGQKAERITTRVPAKGVVWCDRQSGYMAIVHLSFVMVLIGVYRSSEEAVAARGARLEVIAA